MPRGVVAADVFVIVKLVEEIEEFGPDVLVLEAAAAAEVVDCVVVLDDICFSNISLSVLQSRPSSLSANSSPGANCLLHIQHRKQSM